MPAESASRDALIQGTFHPPSTKDLSFDALQTCRHPTSTENGEKEAKEHERKKRKEKKKSTLNERMHTYLSSIQLRGSFSILERD